MKKSMIVLHGSASKWGDVPTITQWHVQDRGWMDIGYNLVVLNGYLKYDDWKTKRKQFFHDGQLQAGRDLNDNPHDWMAEMGAHAMGYNEESIGICLISDSDLPPTRKQVHSTLLVCAFLVNLYKIDWQNVKGHYELDVKKIDPYMNMDKFRDHLVNAYLHAPLSDWIFQNIVEIA